MFRVVRSGLILNLRKTFAAQVDMSSKEGNDTLQQQKGFPMVIGKSASEGIIVPGSLAGAPEWIEQLGLGSCADESDGRGLQDYSATAVAAEKVSQVCLIYDRDGYTLCAFNGRKADDLRSWFSLQ